MDLGVGSGEWWCRSSGPKVMIAGGIQSTSSTRVDQQLGRGLKCMWAGWCGQRGCCDCKRDQRPKNRRDG